jgi:hypothetical protein
MIYDVESPNATDFVNQILARYNVKVININKDHHIGLHLLMLSEVLIDGRSKTRIHDESQIHQEQNMFQIALSRFEISGFIDPIPNKYLLKTDEISKIVLAIERKYQLKRHSPTFPKNLQYLNEDDVLPKFSNIEIPEGVLETMFLNSKLSFFDVHVVDVNSDDEIGLHLLMLADVLIHDSSHRIIDKKHNSDEENFSRAMNIFILSYLILESHKISYEAKGNISSLIAIIERNYYTLQRYKNMLPLESKKEYFPSKYKYDTSIMNIPITIQFEFKQTRQQITCFLGDIFEDILYQICRIIFVQMNSVFFVCNNALVDDFKKKCIADCFFLIEKGILRIFERTSENKYKICSSSNLGADKMHQYFSLEEYIINNFNHNYSILSDIKVDYDSFHPDEIPLIEDFQRMSSKFDNDRTSDLNGDKIYDHIGSRCFVLTFKCESLSIFEANSKKFKELICQYFNIPLEAIFTIEAHAGSLVFFGFTDYHINIELFHISKHKSDSSIDTANNPYENKKTTKEQIHWKNQGKFDIQSRSLTIPNNIEKITNYFQNKDQSLIHRFLPIYHMKEPSLAFLLNEQKVERFFTTVISEVDELLKLSQIQVRISGIAHYQNENFEKRFFQAFNPKTDLMKYLFHGCSNIPNEGHHPLVYNGFSNKLKGYTDSGYFGKGFYFTSYIDYALFYQLNKWNISKLREEIKKTHNTFKMMVFLVRLGNCQELNKSHPMKPGDEHLLFIGTEFPDDLDSRHIIVGRKANNNQVFFPIECYPNSDLVFDEYVIKDKYNALPQFTIKFKIPEITLIWRDTEMFEDQNTIHFNQIKNKYSKKLTLIAVQDNETAFSKINEISEKMDIFIISNRNSDGLEFLNICQKDIRNQFLIFSQDISKWDKNQWISITNEITEVEQYINRILNLQSEKNPIFKPDPHKQESYTAEEYRIFANNYYFGKGVQIDKELSLKYFKLAIEGHSKEALDDYVDRHKILALRTILIKVL